MDALDVVILAMNGVFTFLNVILLFINVKLYTEYSKNEMQKSRKPKEEK